MSFAASSFRGNGRASANASIMRVKSPRLKRNPAVPDLKITDLVRVGDIR
jgi:hypothetical protein